MVARKRSKVAFMAKGFRLPLGQRLSADLAIEKLFKWTELHSILVCASNIQHFRTGCKFFGHFSPTRFGGNVSFAPALRLGLPGLRVHSRHSHRLAIRVHSRSSFWRLRAFLGFTRRRNGLECSRRFLRCAFLRVHATTRRSKGSLRCWGMLRIVTSSREPLPNIANRRDLA